MSTMYSGSVAISCECVHNGFSIFYQTICSIHFVIIRKFRGRGAPYQNTYKLLKINGISAQGKVNGVNDTLGPPHDSGLKGIAPCKGRTSRIGQRPLDTNGRIVGKWHALVERWAHGNYAPM